MSDNLLIGPDAPSRFTLRMLRAYEGQGPIGQGRKDVVENVFFSCDPDVEITGHFESDASNILKIRMQTSGSPRWQALHIELGSLFLGDAAIVGVVARSQAAFSTTTRLCIRSGIGGSFLNSFFPKTMASFSKPSTHLDVLDLTAVSDMPKQAEWRDLILFFRPGDVGMEILDLRLFVV